MNFAPLALLLFIKDNKTLYSATSWAGMVGIFTACKPNIGSI